MRRAPYLRTALAAVFLFWLTVLASAAGLLLVERDAALRRAELDALHLSAVLEEGTARTFDGVDVALEGLAGWLGRERFARHDPAVRALMRAQLQYLPTVRALFVIGPDGVIQHDTDYPKTPDLSLADRDYFRQYLADPGLRKALSPALQSRSGTGWFVASTRHIAGPDGRFGGLVVAAVQLETVSRLFRELELAPGQVMSLLQADGTLLARHPRQDGVVGRNFAPRALFTQHLPKAGEGAFRVDGGSLGYPRILSYRRLKSQPLVVAFSTSEDTVLAGWRRALGGAIAALVAFTALTAGGTLLFVQRQQQRERALRHKAAAAEAQALAEALRRADRYKGEFLATLSHELRNTLAPIHNGLLILDRAPPQSAPAERAREMLQRQLEQMRRLVDDMMDVARVSSGKVRLERERLDLRELLAGAAEAAQAFMQQPGHQLSTRLPDEALPLDGDRTRLQQVLSNLLANAAKYTPPGGRIALTARREGRQAVVEVIDNGLGMPPAAQARVFDMFEQVSEHLESAQGGMGIGLALVRQLVALHGGRVAAWSAGPGQGSTFTVWLPLAEADGT